MVALIAILAVIALITINPFEAQKRTRDARRLKELGSLQGIMEQYISDTQNVPAMDRTSTDGTNACSTDGWMGVDMCNYANTLSQDPLNRSAEFTLADGSATEGPIVYEAHIDAELRYRICSRLESSANSNKLNGDGVPNDWFELYSSTEAPLCGS